MRKSTSVVTMPLLFLIGLITIYVKCVKLAKKRNNRAIISYTKEIYLNKKKKKAHYTKFYICNFTRILKKEKKKFKEIFKINRGSGTTCSYEWVEGDDNIEVKISLAPDVNPEDIQYTLKNDYIYAKLKDKPQSLIEGKLKGSVDINFSTWFLEKYDDYCIMNIYLKKKDKGINEWVGVVEKENIIHIQYDNVSSSNSNLGACTYKSLNPNELLYSQHFENVKYDDIYNFLLNWANTKSNNQNEFGIPKMKLKTTVMNNEHEIEIIILGYNLKWEAEDSIVLKLASSHNGVELNVHRGNVASGIRGIHGNMVSFLVKECEQRIIKKLQHDLKGVFYLNPLSKKAEDMMHKHCPQNSYNYVMNGHGKPKHISINRDEPNDQMENGKNINNVCNTEKKENEENIHKKNERTELKEIKKDSPEEELIVEELKLNSKVNLTCEDKSKEPEFMKDWSEEKKVEFRRNSVLELKKNLELSQENKLTMKLEDYINHMKISFDLTEEEAKLVWKKGMAKSNEHKNRERFYRFIEVENLTDKISMYEKIPEKGNANPSIGSGHHTSEEEYSYRYASQGEKPGSRISVHPLSVESNPDKFPNKGNLLNPNNVDFHLNEQKEKNQTIHNIDVIDLTKKEKIDKVENKFKSEKKEGNINRRFFNCLEEELLDPEDKEKLTLYEIYVRSEKEEKREMREKWKINELRLNTLTQELAYADDDMIPTVCNNYRDLLLSDEYACLMKLRLEENPPKNKEEQKILHIINSFAMSLYDDIKIIMEHEEKEHLKKIQLICEKAVYDEKGLNEFIESMKPLLDYSFLGYIKHAIKMEKKRIKMQNIDFRENPSDWLIILMIIQKGIYSILEKDIWQDVINITTIICHDQPSVRKTILTTMLASMPKADWIFFKDVIKTIYKCVQEKKITANHFPDFPHIPEAIFQLNYDIEQVLPDWFIKEMLDQYDKSVVELMKSRKPLFWKMKETKWDKNFVHNFKQLQVEKYHQYEKCLEGPDE
ncbi:hypothetical protein, conserved [Plasmodium gonderi]|uniref:NudC domain-containing protein 1 n=1 Tax=Plasmodium gonderi TaxID=77519 RepID=A0A1Y1JG05_PLAGO|nr:hypothetical protein, conserved [Plasmodium gonderi]GAW80265.1 hypothetical protein, conserved [Plasmodium gonderi]